MAPNASASELPVPVPMSDTPPVEVADVEPAVEVPWKGAPPDVLALVDAGPLMEEDEPMPVEVAELMVEL